MLYLCIYSWVASFAIGTIPPKPNKIALLITIGEYKDQDWYKERNHKPDSLPAHLQESATNNHKFIRELLVKQGFEIIPIVDKNATKQGIANGFEKAIKNSDKNAIVFIYYFGHGRQVRDRDGDEIEDHMDEAICPYDNPYNEKKGIQNLILDDDINRWLTRLRRKVGNKGQVVLMMESCFSGSADRGDNDSSDSDTTITLSAPPVGFASYKDKENHFMNDKKEIGSGLTESKVIKSSNLSPFIFFSACEAKKEAKAKKMYMQFWASPMTYHFCQLCETIKKPIVYRRVFDLLKVKVKGLLSNDQELQLEGDIDCFVF